MTCYNNGIDQNYRYTYDSNGIRIGKELDEYGYISDTVQYLTDGTKILKEIRYNSYDNETYELYYHYDENDSPVGFSLNDQDYFF